MSCRKSAKCIQPVRDIFDRTIFLKHHILVLLTALFLTCTAIHASADDKAFPLPEWNTGSERDADAAPEEAESPDTADEDAQAGASDDESENATTPSVHLDSNLLYEILVANFAQQQGDNRRAFRNMMRAAKKTRDPRLAMQAVEIAVSERKSREALQALRFWFELEPDSRDAERILFGFLLYENRYDELQTRLSAVLTKTPAESRGARIYQFQQLLSGSTDKAKAFRVLERVVRPYDDIPESHISLSILAFANKDTARALTEAHRALQIKPDSELAILTLAQAKPDPVRSIQALTEFLEKYPDSREVRIAKARMLISQKEYDKAKDEFEKVLTTDEDHVLALFSVGLLSIQNNDLSGAERYLKRYLDVLKKENRPDSESYEAIFLLAQLEEERKNYKAALEWIDTIVAESGSETSFLAQIRRAQILARMGRIKDAKSGLAALRAAYPAEEESLIMTEAQILRSVRRHRDAYTLLKTASRQTPSNINLLYDFALAAERVARYDEMEEALRSILALDPNNQMAYNALGYSLADRNTRLDEAYVLIAKALALAPDDPYITDSMGWILFRQGMLDEAELLLRRAYERMPDGEVIAHLGEVLWSLGRQDEALQIFREGKRKDPDNEVLKETIRRLGVRLK